MLETFYSNKKNILKKSQEFFQNSSLHHLKIGVELEFFLCEENLGRLEDEGLIAQFILELEEKLKEQFSFFYKVEKEQGAAQIEIKTVFTQDLEKLADELETAKKFIKNFAKEKKLIANFAAQPFADDCGSALQFNISLHDENDENIFENDENILGNIAAGLLELTNSMMIFLAPKTEDYARFSFTTNYNLFKKGKFTAPINLSLGNDNRTCAIRIVATKKDQKNPTYKKRLEYRIAAADADSHLSIAAIIVGISHGIKNNLQPEKSGFTTIFGNAFDEQYKLKTFCKNLEEAEKFFAEGNLIKEKFEEFCS
jgi:glutamine synthetase